MKRKLNVIFVQGIFFCSVSFVFAFSCFVVFAVGNLRFKRRKKRELKIHLKRFYRSFSGHLLVYFFPSYGLICFVLPKKNHFYQRWLSGNGASFILGLNSEPIYLLEAPYVCNQCYIQIQWFVGFTFFFILLYYLAPT